MFSLYNSYIIIHTNNIRHNVETILSALPEKCELIPVLKGNAYGLGLEKITEILREFCQIKTIAVSQISEARKIIDSGADIMLTGPIWSSDQLAYAVENNIIVLAHQTGIVASLAVCARNLGKKGRINIKINCGLNRYGVKPGDELRELMEEIHLYRDVISAEGVYSHFSDLQSPDGEAFDSEHAIFMQAVSQLEAGGIKTGKKHISASAAFEFHPEEAMDAVRIGRRLYYDNPIHPRGDILDGASWRTTLAAVRTLSPGEKCGYSGSYVADKETKIGILPVGYGDGMQLNLVSAGAPVLINGSRAYLIGCCMDCCFVNLEGIDCAVGDEVTLFGYDSVGNLLPGQEVAGYMKDEAVTLTTALTDRVCRVYE